MAWSAVSTGAGGSGRVSCACKCFDSVALLFRSVPAGLPLLATSLPLSIFLSVARSVVESHVAPRSALCPLASVLYPLLPYCVFWLMDKRGICFANTWQAAWLKNFTAHMGLHGAAALLLVFSVDMTTCSGVSPWPLPAVRNWLNYQRAVKIQFQIENLHDASWFVVPIYFTTFVQHANYRKWNCRNVKQRPFASPPFDSIRLSARHNLSSCQILSSQTQQQRAANESRALINREFINTQPCQRCH